ncbi:MAG TPA: prephenate dehydrogenase [Acidimicrobiales bacterium]|nr:prephenate dehydrogenase [Acidimicrobiales bacterium]
MTFQADDGPAEDGPAEDGPTEGGPAEGGRRALLVGTGLIGGSVGLGLRARGWQVTGDDADPTRAAAALAAGAVDRIGDDPTAELAFVATPAGAVAAVAGRLLADSAAGRRRPDLVVTDVAGVKAPVVAAVDHPRFVGGHPMAGSEQVGLDGADPDLFTGATWVLTPTANTDPEAFARLQAAVTSLGADVVALAPAEHDQLVAVVSHVPHLVAATLMNAATRGAEEHAALLRLAAGGFRDMTRVAAGHPGIWPDICAENAGAIVVALDQVLADLTAMRDRVADADREGLLEVLGRASTARRSLPARAARPERLAELRVPVPDREGVLAEITTLAGDLGINIYDIEIAHSAEGPRGVLLLVVDADQAAKLRDAMTARRYRSTVQVLS